MRIYKILLEFKKGKEWVRNWRFVSVHAKTFNEAINKVKLEEDERIEEVELIAESDF